MRAAVFLDRDGVLNRVEVRDGKPYAPRSVDHFRLFPGVSAAVQRLRDAGFLVIVATNQPDIANGLVDRSVVESMHSQLRRQVMIDAIEMCPHRDADGCQCRKPKPGLLVAAAHRLSIDLHRSFLVGDRSKDIMAGRAAGCYTVFVDRGYDEPRPVEADAIVRSLPAAVRRILTVATMTTSGEARR